MRVYWGGAEVNNITVSGYSGTVYWNTSASSSGKSSNYSNITDGKKIYIVLKTSDITTTKSNITIKFTQDTITYYKSRIVTIQDYSDWNDGQCDLTFAAQKKTFTGTCSINADTTPEEGNLVISKSDYLDDDDVLEGISFRILYADTSGDSTVYYWVKPDTKGTSSCSSVTYVKLGNSRSGCYFTTDSDGEISIENLQLGTYYIYEFSYKWPDTSGYYFEDQAAASNEPDDLSGNTNIYSGSYSYVYKGKAKVKSGITTSKSITNHKSGTITINKTGYNSENVTANFALVYYNSYDDDDDNYYWVKGNATVTSLRSYSTKVTASNSSSAATYTTTSGSVTINYLRLGYYYIYETAISSAGYYLSDQEETLTTEPEDLAELVPSDWKYCGYRTIGKTSNNKERTLNVTNTTGALKITKYDYDSYQDDKDITLQGAKFALIYTSDGTNYYWVNGSASGTKEYYNIANYSSSYATIYKTGSDGTVTINYLKQGYYFRYETDIVWSSSNGSIGYYLEDTYESSSSPDGISKPSDVSSISSKIPSTWVYKSYNTITSSTTPDNPREGNLANPKSGTLTINKYGYDKSTKIEARFALLYYDSDDETYYWVSGGNDNTTKKTYTAVNGDNYSSYAREYSTTSGTISIYNLRIGKYYLYETYISTSGYYLEDQDDASSAPNVTVGTNWRYCGSYTVNRNTETVTDNTTKIVNTTGALQITKYDEDSSTKLNNFEFVFVWASSTKSTTYYYVSGSTTTQTTKSYNQVGTNGSGTYTTYTTGTDTNLSSGTGTITLDYIKEGIYYIYETGTSGDPYYLTDQDEASNEPNALSSYINSGHSTWKYQGYIEVTSSTTPGSRATTIHTSSSTTTTKILNYKRIKIAGYVWVDEDINKDDTYNSYYDKGTETLVQGVTVYLYNKTTGQVTVSSSVTNLTTSSDGSYTFGYEWGVQYRYISNYYIKFDYGDLSIKEAHDATEASSGTEFIPVAFNRGTSTTSTIYAKSSKAMMDSVATYDVDLSGEATTYAGTSDSYEELYGLSAFLSSSNETIYNNGTYTLTNINLGIKKIYDPGYDIVENLAYVKIVCNGQQYMYKYNIDYELNSEGNIVYSGNEPQVAFQDEANVEYYTRYFYPSDIQQLKDKYNTDGSEPLKVYVVYGMIIENTETYDVDELYVENYLKIESLTNTFDTDRYTLDSTTTKMNEIEEAVCEDFDKWTVSGDTATYTIDSDDSDEELNKIGSEESVTKYIQFKVNASAVIDILNGETIESKPTSVQTVGRHYYKRNDYSWSNGIYKKNETHITGTKEKTDDAPYLKFILGADRELSGYVFEDTDDNVDDDEILGNGIYDSGENKVAYVKVELLDASTDQVAQLCSYTTDSGGNKTYSFTEASCVITGTDGAFTFTGLAVGDYYLRFTYYDENNEEVDSTTNTSLKTTIISSDGTTKTFSLNDYKSTIVTSDPVIAAINKEYGNEYDTSDYTEEWYKYFDDANNTYYSVAVDDLEQREDYNDGLVYTYNDDGDGEIDSVESHSYDSSGTEITKMEAYSPEFSITIENDTETSSSATDTNGENTTHLYEYTGFNFGIIEQAEQKVEVEKVITNVSMVNSPTTIFNGNPEDGLNGVSDLDGSTNGSSTYTRIEVEENEMYGANFTVTYEITITNTSDLNYYETNSDYHGYYYMFGLHDDAYSAEVEISIDSVLDAYDDDLTWSISNIGEDTYEYTITSSVTESGGSSNANTETTLTQIEESDWTNKTILELIDECGTSGTILGCTYEDLLTVYNYCANNLYSYQYGITYNTSGLMISNSTGYYYDSDPDVAGYNNWTQADEDSLYKITIGYDSIMAGYGLEGYFIEVEEDTSSNTSRKYVNETVLTLMENKANTRSDKGYDYDELLYMESWGNISREESLSISIVFTKTMSASDDDTSYENVSSVNELSIAVNSNSSISSDKDSTKYVRKPQLPDPADSYITISPPTGESESIIPYVVIGVIGLIILSAGIVIIKKKIL